MRPYRILTILIPLTILMGCGEGDGPARILNEPAAPFAGPPDSCFEALTFEDICDQAINFVEFEGAPGRTVDNPDQGGINPSAKVAEFVKLRASSGATFGGTIVDFSAFGHVDVPAGSFITAKVWSQRPVNVLFEPEGGGPGSGDEVRHGGTGWEELTFNLNISGTITGWVFIFDNGTNGDGGTDPLNWTFYADDISLPMGGGGGGPATTLPVDFEADPATYDFGPDGGFEGGAASVVANPDPSGINTSAQVGQMQKFPGEVFGGATLGIEPTTVEAGSSFTMKVWSQRAVPVLLQPEPQGPGSGIEVIHGGTGWEELTFSLPGLSGTVSGITVIFDNGTAGAADTDPTNWTFYFDDITLVPPGGGGGGTQVTLPVTFDDAGVDYELQDFGGVVTTLVADPADAGNTVASSNKPPGAEVWGGTTVANVSGFASALPFTATDTTMTVRVYSPDAGIPVRLKVEDKSDNTVSVETEATTTVANAWETLTFDFSNEASGTAALNLASTYDKASIFFNFGTDGNTAGDKTYLWENLIFVTGGGGGSASIDFESGSATFNDFDGGVAAVIANPDSSGINTSAWVAEMQKSAGQPWGGSTLDLGGAVPLAANDSYTMKVRSSRAVDVTLKLEPLNEERVVTHSGSGTWEELCFDFTGVSGDVTGITVIFDNGTMGDATNDPDNWTFQFDDIQQTSSCPVTSPSFTAITFDDPAITYTLTDFGGNTSTVTNDPAGGTNMVAQAVKSATAELWAGTTVSTEPNDAVPTIPLDAANTQMTVRVYSPDAGIPVRLKVEDASDDTITVETEATTTMVNAWETLTFDFANEVSGTAAFNEANTYNKISIFFNFGTDGATVGVDKTYYFDDIDVGTGGGGGTGVALPVTFDDAGVDYELQDFGGVVTTLVADPADAGNTVASTNKPPGAEVWGGTTVADVSGFASALPFTATDTVMTVRVYSPDAGIPVRLKVEDKTDNTVSVETEAMTTMANAWETLTFDFSNEVSGTAALNLASTYDKASIFFNFGTDGNTAGDKTYLWEDLAFVTGGGGGGSFAPITFDDTGITYTLTGFGGAEDSTIQVDPDGGSNLVARVVKSNSAEVWAGTTVSTGVNESIPTLPLDASNTQMTVRVYSPDAGIQVRLKVEDASDPTKSVETEATTTLANTWETLTFDFANEAAGTAAFDPATTYNKVSIFFNFGVDGATAGEKTYHFDDIATL